MTAAAMRASFPPFLVLSAPYSIRGIHDAALAAFAAAAAVTARWSAATALPCLTRLSNFDPCLPARPPAFLHAKSSHSMFPSLGRKSRLANLAEIPGWGGNRQFGHEGSLSAIYGQSPNHLA